MGCVIPRADEVQPDIWVDVAAARGKSISLILTDRGVQRLELAVEVRAADAVVVNERQLADTGAHQRLDCVAADAAEAENGHMAFCSLSIALAPRSICVRKN